MLRHIRFLESFHIPLWLLKDTCWMLQLKTPAIIMILPTMTVAIWIAWVTRANRTVFLPNLAVCFWITANAIWMLGEFYAFNHIIPAVISFGCGMVVILAYFVTRFSMKGNNNG